MSWFTKLIQALPILIEWVGKFIMEYRKKKILLNLEKALKKSKQLKDTSDIEKILNNYNSD